ncbi:hypothetical protein CBR_g82149, partial [Chara braunii]
SKPITYELLADIDRRISVRLLAEAEDAVARLDARARYSPFRTPWMQRMLYGEACAASLVEGELVLVSDLVMFDQGGWNGGPREDLMRARQSLLAWRRAVRANAPRMLGEIQTDQLRPGGADRASDLDRFWDEAWGAEDRLTAWHQAVELSRRLPPLLSAAIAWDAWMLLQPDQIRSWKSTLGAALVLKMRRKTSSCLLPLNTGWRFSSYRRMPHHSIVVRLNGFLEWSLKAAEHGNQMLEQMSRADCRLRVRLEGRRRNSRLGQLVEFFYASPLVSIPAAARKLGCSQQAISGMLKELGSSIREVTERPHYRMWTLT